MTPMERALALAAQTPRCVLPNPRVGAVITYRGEVVGEGYHRGPGYPHAEVEAVRNAKRRGFRAFSKAEIFVTLEPCCHTNKRTPPCVPLLIENKFKRVTIAHLDPNPEVSGKGVRLLKRAGIEVKTGILRSSAEQLNQAFLKNQQHQSPYVTLKLALSFDGKMADDFGRSQWITREEAREDVHRLRLQVDAIGVGASTFDRDNPQLNVREMGKIFSRKVVIFGKPKRSLSRSKAARVNGLENMTVVPSKGSLRSHLKSLYRDKKICHLLVEGGPRLATTLLKAGLVDELILYYGRGFAGGRGNFALFPPQVEPLSRLDQWTKFIPSSTELLGPDVKIRGLLNVYRTH